MVKVILGIKYILNIDIKTQIILSFELTPAHVHDSQKELFKDKLDYKDKAYADKNGHFKDGRMRKNYKNQKLPPVEIERNYRISCIRSPSDETTCSA
jgi:hypothetical protein